MKYKLYTKSKNAWDAIISEMKKAEKSIYIETYIFNTDIKESHDFISVLKEKAEKGVRVIMVADSFGSPDLKKETVSLQKSRVEILFFSHWLRHIHRKIYIIDGKTVFMGGVNIGKRFRNWNDLQLKMRGKKIVNRITKSFSYTYEMAGGKDKELLEIRKKKISYKLKFWLVEHWPQRNIHTLRRSYEERISNAKNKITIVTPYFAPPRWLISLLDNARKRGVEIEVLVPRKTDGSFANRINLFYMDDLSQIGIKFFMTKEMNHSKLMLLDESEAVIGSQNLDSISFRINMEAGVFFKEKSLISELTRTINLWKKDAEEFNSIKRRKTMLDYIIITLIKILWPIL